MQDAEMVEAILAGQTAGIAAAYDRYAPALYSFCRSLLGEPADAADAVQDTFIIAAGRVAGLRDPSRLRPWLYAVARNECRRRLRTRASSAPLEEAGEVTDETVDLSADSEKAELRALVAAAVAGLNPGDREIIELNLRHELGGGDLADALGVSPNQAHALASRARSQFETSLGALLVARTGRESCPELAAILTGWDGQLNVLMRKRINRHIEHCELCGARRRRELSPAMLLGMLPVALIPAALRDHLLNLVGDFSPVPSAYRAGVINRAGQFGRSGFPRPLDPPHLVHAPTTPTVAAGTGAAAAGVIAAGILFAGGLRGPAPQPPGGEGAAPPPGSAATPSSPAGAKATPTASASGGSSASPAAGLAVPGVAVTALPVTIPTSLPPGGLASPPVPSPSSVVGTLVSSTTVVNLQLGVTGSFTLTAQGGPVSGIRIQNPDPLDLTVSLGTTSLAAGGTTTVTLLMVNPLASSVTLVVNPGGLSVTVNATLVG